MTPDETTTEEKSARSYWGFVLWRLIAALLLLVVFPMLLLMGVLLRANSTEPVVVADEVLRKDGTKLRVHRFRTTGEGNEAFHMLGRFIRYFGIDDLLGLWDVARGGLSLRQFYTLTAKK
jgi:lipopolysaccharide/colanic/teichoic acid biosynthesis glycosyltransferase